MSSVYHVSTPGSPRSASDFVGNMSSPRDRGYNFPAVVRWFAERADVILLFFDPDKPVGAWVGVVVGVLMYTATRASVSGCVAVCALCVGVRVRVFVGGCVV